MKIRKAILTAGGKGTRLHPITTTINKHLLPLANKPMIFHAIEKAVEAGVREIFINVNPGEEEIQKYIGDGGHWGIKIEFFEQTGGAQGIAHAVNEAYRFIGNDPFLFYLSDNVLLGSITDMVEEFNQGNYHCMLALSTVPDPERFGVPIFDEQNRLVDVWEKPTNPPNNFAVTGIYLYAPKVFFEAFKNIKRSARGEYEISSIHSHLLKQGMKVGYKEITGWWKDTGQTEDLLIANKLLLDKMKDTDFVNNATIEAGAIVSARVRAGQGSRLGKNAEIRGPVIIAENCVLQNCVVGPYVTIGAGTEIDGANIQNSIILDSSVIRLPINITNSLIGKKVQLIKRQGNEIEGHRLIIGDKTVLEM